MLGTAGMVVMVALASPALAAGYALASGRPVALTCIDGDANCDADGLTDGRCRVDLCVSNPPCFSIVGCGRVVFCPHEPTENVSEPIRGATIRVNRRRRFSGRPLARYLALPLSLQREFANRTVVVFCDPVRRFLLSDPLPRAAQRGTARGALNDPSLGIP